MRIRCVVESDTEAVIGLWREVFPEYYDVTRPQRDPRASIARKLSFGDGLFWLGEEDARVIATAMAGYDGHRGWIYSIGVAPARRRQGHARALLTHAEAQLCALGCPKINIQVLSANEPALRFWRSAGYEIDDVVSLGRRL
jgi:ribosomal protein S18 acetylase RimI-like enzyme